MPHTAGVLPISPDGRSSAEELLQQARRANHAAAARLRHQVVLDHHALATSIAHRYDNRGLEREDLEQVALLGLVQAVRRFQPDRGSGFVAFAVPTITGELKRHFRDHGWAVRPPRQLQERSLTVRSCTEELTQALGREPGTAEIARSMGLSVEDVACARAVDGQYVARSMDAPIEYDAGTTLGDTLGRLEPDLERIETFEALRPVLRDLPAREKLILRLRFVDNLTQQQIGAQIGVSQMQVSRLLSDILRRLRAAIAPAQDPVRAAS
ncbi:SigB/SigF/SigG family RNA polymerase sigma factor [Flexivirga caeni]|uniref:SigB/SigF/SigG family RNA polymerase sigma factor n=1 Tax=Flexivirga caeni TaxID=2294115 RepID=A0A3M9ME60_9MICO|nr:SigB/SigF/SigG family RNA polymerase sigma factor [Flexivirga caeni]RNI22898.1 SigB/SigF/SigG family RNA polymerase sigma factor [Flexivirga caeni]